MLYDRVKYVLKYDGIETVIQEPIGWDEANIIWARNKTYHGISVQVSTPLEYHGNAKDIILDLYDKYGVNANAVLELWKRNKYTDVLELNLVASLDFKTLEIKNGVFIKFNASEVVSKFKKDAATAIEYDRIDRLDGTNREVHDTFDETEIEGIKATTTTVLIMKEQTIKNYTMSFDANGAERRGALPFKLENGGDICEDLPHKDAAEVGDVDQWTTYPDRNGIFSSFWRDSKENVTINLTIDATISMHLHFELIVKNRWYELVVVVYDENGDFVRIARTLKRLAPPNDGFITFSVSDSFSINVRKKQSVSIQHRWGGNFGNFWKRGRYLIRFVGYTNTANVTITTDTTVKKTKTKTIKALNMFKSISDACFNSEFNSNYLESGLFKNLMISNGFMFRGFLDKQQGYTNPTISFKDLFESLNVLSPIGVEVAQSGITLESLDYFYNDSIYKDLGDVQNLVLSVDDSFIHSQVEIGFTKVEKQESGGDLSEFNAKTEYTTAIVGAERKLSLLSKIRGDSTGIEKARRGYFLEKETTTSSDCADDKTKSNNTDNDIWFLDTVLDGGKYRVAKWADHFSMAPTGIPNATTYYNYRFTPRNIAERHIPVIRQAYNNLRDMRLIFANTTSTKGLVTFPIGSQAMRETSSVNMNNAEPLTLGLKATFDTYYMFNDINGYSGDSRNYYSLLKFSSNGAEYLGYINKITLNKGKSTVECIIKVIIR